MTTKVYHADCARKLARMETASVDLIVSSPPYCMKRAYEASTDDINTFRQTHMAIFDHLYRVLKPGGSICWQIGYHVSNGCVIPLDFLVYDIFSNLSRNKPIPLTLRNRIIWTFGHGLNNSNRFSGRHETILWFSKGEPKTFNLDEIRIPQKYPGKRAYKGANKGELTGNPLGKNPSDVWDIPNVKANHCEKTEHPCQFPVALPLRFVLALTNEDDLVLDPFMGSGTTGVAAVLAKRSFVGIELNSTYMTIARKRIRLAKNGKAPVRADVPVAPVDNKSSVAKLPKEFQIARNTFFHP